MRDFLKPILFWLLIIAFPNYSLASVAPFGLELDKATMKDLESKYDILRKTKGKNNVTSIEISPRLLSLKGLQGASFLFDDRDVLQAVVLTMDKSNFDEMYGILSEKYKLTEKNIPFVGDKSASFSQEDCSVLLEAPHLGFNLSVTYVTNTFFKKFRDKQRDQEKRDLDTKKAAL